MLTTNPKHAFNDLTYARLKEYTSSSATVFKLMKGYLIGLLQGWATGRNLYVTITDAERNLEICKVTDMGSDKLTVERGQGGTVAQNWPEGSLIIQRLVAANLGRFHQNGEYRTINYNPNGVLSANYPGEKVYETGANPCQVRWWINSETNKWRLLAGVKCDWEYYDDGYVKTAYLDYACDSADGWIKNTNVNWNTCRTAGTGDETNDDGSGFLYGGKIWAAHAAGNYIIHRTFLYFDLNGAPLGITGVELHVRAKSGGSDPIAIVQEGTQGSSLSNGDYDAFTGNEFGTFDPDTTEGDLSLTFNAFGYSYVEGIVGSGGIAKLCLREYAHDHQNLVVPDFYSYAVSIYLENDVHEEYRPFLRLRYD